MTISIAPSVGRLGVVMVSTDFNPHHRRMWINATAALNKCGLIIQEAEADTSNTSQELNDQATQAYIILQDMVMKLDKRRRDSRDAKVKEKEMLIQAKTMEAK